MTCIHTHHGLSLFRNIRYVKLTWRSWTVFKNPTPCLMQVALISTFLIFIQLLLALFGLSTNINPSKVRDEETLIFLSIVYLEGSYSRTSKYSPHPCWCSVYLEPLRCKFRYTVAIFISSKGPITAFPNTDSLEIHDCGWRSQNEEPPL